MEWKWAKGGRKGLHIYGAKTAGICLPDSRNSSGHKLYFRNIPFLLSPFKALADCSASLYLLRLVLEGKGSLVV